MSKYLSKKYEKLTPYTPGEQPRDMQKYIKLNTNESPFSPPPSVVDAVKTAGETVRLYSDPTNKKLVEAGAEVFGVKESQLLFTNGSDEILNFAFMAFCDENTPAIFPDITYGFYSVFANLNGVPYKTVALKGDFSIDYREYFHAGGTVFIANPNAPTGLALTREQVEEILQNNPNNVVVIDEAYVDFGGESCVPLIEKYENLLITQTFSKSRSMAGARLGVGIACEKLIADLNTIKYSTNPYNVNAMTIAAGVAALREETYFKNNCKIICENRAYTTHALQEMGFTVLDSKANFVFAQTEKIGGKALYEALKSKGVLVRNFTGERIKDFIRVTIGTKAQMDAFLQAVKEILAKE